MKKLSFVAVMAIIAAMFAACGKSTTKADLNTDIDTLSYAFGIEQSQGIKMFLQQLEIDTAYMDEFVKGLNTGVEGAENKKEAAHNAGVMIGLQLSMMQKNYSRQIFAEDSTKSLSTKNLIAGFVAGTTGKDIKIAPENARMISSEIAKNLQMKEAEKKFAKEKKANDDYMAANAKKEGVQKLDKGVQYKVIKTGTGAKPTKDDIAIINYEGKNIDGKTFDKQDKAKMPVGRAIPGFTEALLNMPVGSKWEVYIPYSAGYGAQQVGADLKPFSTLIFTVELLGIEEIQKPAAPAQSAQPATPNAQ